MLNLEFSYNSLVTYLLGTIPIAAYLLKLTIDNWGATDLEKLRMSNFKRFQIAFTKYVVLGIFFLAISYVILATSDKITVKVEGDILLAITIVCSIFFIAFMFIIDKILMFLSKILIFQYDYYVVDQDGNAKYRIIKASSKNTLLVEANEIEEFLDANENRRYKKVLRENKILEKIYGSKWIVYLITVLVLIDIGLLIGLILTRLWVQFLFYLSFLFLFIISLFISLSYLYYKKLNKNNKN